MVSIKSIQLRKEIKFQPVSPVNGELIDDVVFELHLVSEKAKWEEFERNALSIKDDNTVSDVVEAFWPILKSAVVAGEVLDKDGLSSFLDSADTQFVFWQFMEFIRTKSLFFEHVKKGKAKK